MIDKNLNTLNRLVVGFSRFGKARPVTAGHIVKGVGEILRSTDLSEKHKIKRCQDYVDYLLPKVIKTEIKIPDLSEELFAHILEEDDFARIDILLIKNGVLKRCIIPINARDSKHTSFR